MEIQSYIDQKIDIQNLLLEFIDEEIDENNLLFIAPDKNLPNLEYREELRELLYLILKISNNHHRCDGFFNKIKQIFLILKEDINNSFSKAEIFDIFKSNKRIILLLLETEIIVVDETITNLIIKKSNILSTKISLFKEKNQNDNQYCHYFYPEIKPFIDNEKNYLIKNELLKIDPQIFNSFDQKRKIGENDSHISELIRNDQVGEFISYVNIRNLPLINKIKPSMFETNPFLINKEPTFIEYAAFFGSIQIFQYLKMNKVVLTPSLWLYAIHGNKPELIHLLEENRIKPEDKTYFKCLEEAIKCHHNNIANYIQSNLLNQKMDDENCQKKFNENSIAFCFHYYNYACLPIVDDFINNDFTLFYLCKYNYFNLVTLFVEIKGLKLKEKVFSSIITCKISQILV
ncbi:hypothetical protein M9Y10_007401 [Tritrichomonas musculus]|uniref:DUF3447 domain-containing protein n=1 Tax=Tritrichomonas musculus TaxID=1915356 RepID=A0ABR2J184_9EUKA